MRFQLLPTRTEGSRRPLGSGLGTGQLAQSFQRSSDHAEIGRLALEDGNAQAAQARQLQGFVAAVPGHDQIGFEAGDALQVERVVAAQVGQAGSLRGIVAVIAGTDDLLAGASGVQQFGDMRRQADDAPRRLWQGDVLAQVILDGDAGVSRAGGQQSGEGEQPGRQRTHGSDFQVVDQARGAQLGGRQHDQRRALFHVGC